MSKQDDLLKLSDINDKIAALIKEYNMLAKQNDFETRVGLITASVELYGKDKGRSPEKYITEDYGEAYCGIYAPDAEMWFPSSIDC